MKKFLSLFISAIMVLSLFSALGVPLFAASGGDFDYWVLSEADKTCTISNYSGSAAEITIPSQIDGYTVTEISSTAFSGCTSITEINAEAGNMYFTSLDGVLFNKNKTELIAYPMGNTRTSYIIPDSVKKIGCSALSQCTYLTSVTIPDGVTEIGALAFVGCTSLTGIDIPDSVTVIDSYAFCDCTSIADITVPDGVTYIGSNAFNKTAYYNNESNWENGAFYIGNYFIKAKTSLSGAYKIKDGTKTIASEAFFQCKSLTGVEIPESAVNIGERIFYRCSSLTNVTIPNGVTKIGDYSFCDCISLNGITVPEGVTSIDRSAFEGCSSLTSVTLPSSLTSVGNSAFTDCPLLTSITVPDSVTKIGKEAFGYFYDENSNSPLGYYTASKKDGFAIYGSKGSAAQSYANTNGFIFIPLDGIGNVSMHRLYNPNSGEHFYTADVNEKNNLVSLGWTYEGIGWTAPEASFAPVYRLYNQNGGEHHYTTDVNEKNNLISLGWNDEGIGWYSDEAKGVTVYRQYNPNAFANNHNYTTDKNENDFLISLGWQTEGIGWYGVA